MLLPNNSFSTSFARSPSIVLNLALQVGLTYPLPASYFEVIITKHISADLYFFSLICFSPALLCPSWDPYFQTTFSSIYVTTWILLKVTAENFPYLQVTQLKLSRHHLIPTVFEKEIQIIFHSSPSWIEYLGFGFSSRLWYPS